LIDQTGLIYCAGVQSAPPGFLRLARHPLRWRLVSARRSSRAAFRRVAAELRTRIGFLLARIGE